MYGRYVALGDSMSIDLYPALDAGETQVAVALEFDARAGEVAPLGAASLLYRNDDERWPEFAGDDLVTRMPGIELVSLATDGATIGDVFSDQLEALEALPDRDAPALVTLTAGGNDLLFAMMNGPKPELLERFVRDIAEGYRALVEAVARLLPEARLLLTSVYDPSDDTGRATGIVDTVKALPLEHLASFNAAVRAVAEDLPEARFVDAHAHFMGHGMTAPEAERWYWRRSLIEPSLLGASELRRLWLAEA